MPKGANTFVDSPPQIFSALVKEQPQMKQEHCQAGPGPDDAHLSLSHTIRGILEPQILLPHPVERTAVTILTAQH